MTLVLHATAEGHEVQKHSQKGTLKSSRQQRSKQAAIAQLDGAHGDACSVLHNLGTHVAAADNKGWRHDKGHSTQAAAWLVALHKLHMLTL